MRMEIAYNMSRLGSMWLSVSLCEDDRISAVHSRFLALC